MAVELATGYISLVPETSKIVPGVRAALAGADRIGSDAGRGIGSKMAGGISDSLKGLAVAGIGAALAKSVIGLGNSFTNELNTMQAVSNATVQQMNAVKEAAKGLGNDAQLADTSATDAAAAMTELAKGGFSVEQSMSAARGTLQLAAAAQIDAASAATIQSQALQAFGLDASYAAKAADVLANGANASSAEITDVAAGLQQAGAVANQFGVSLEDTVAGLGMLANAGIQGSDAGTLLKSTLLALTDQSNPAQGAIEDLGLSIYNASGEFVGFRELFGQLEEASKSMTPEMYQAATATLFGSDAMRLAGVAAEQGTAGWDAMRSAIERQGAAAEVAAAKTQGLPGAFAAIQNSAEGFALEVYDLVDGPLAAFASKAASLISDVTPKIMDGLNGLGEFFAPFGEKIAAAFESFNDSGMAQGWGSQLAETFGDLANTASSLAPSIGAVAEAFLTAGAALGLGTWELLLSTLDSIAPILDATLLPALEGVASLMEQNKVATTAFIGGFALFETVPGMIDEIKGPFEEVTGRVSGAIDAVRNFGADMHGTGQSSRVAGVQLGRFGSAVDRLGQRVPVIGAMQTSFLNAATGAQRFGRTAGAAAAASTGLKTAAMGVANAFGGPLIAGIGAAVLIGTQLIGAADDMATAQESNAKSAIELADAQDNVARAFARSAGAINPEVMSALTEQVGTFRDNLTQTAADAPGLMNDIVNWLTPKWDDDMDLGERWDAWWGGANDDLQEAGRVAKETAAALDAIEATNDQVANALAGSNAEWGAFIEKMRESGGASDEVVASLEEQRRKFQEQQESARNLTPGIVELAESFDVLSDSASSAEEKSNALKRTLDILAGVPPELGDSMQRYNELVRDTAEATSDVWDQTKGWGDALIAQNGAVDTSTENGAKLRDSIRDIQDATSDVATSGGDLNATLASNEEMFRKLSESSGISYERLMQIAAMEGYLPEAFRLGIDLDGTDKVTEGLELVRTKLEYFPDEPVKIRADLIDVQARQSLEELGFEITKINETDIAISASNELAIGALNAVLDKVQEVGAQEAIPRIGADDTEFRITDAATLESLGNLDRSLVSPEIGAIIDQFLAGEAVTLEKLAALDTSKADPQVLLQIQDALTNAAVVNKAIDEAARNRTTQIAVQFATNYEAARAANPGFLGPLSVTTRANGGIDRLPEQARIQPGSGAGLVQWAEGETGGEAFIPLAESKRGRSTQILAEVADRFGMRLESYADGGIRRAMDAAYAGTGKTYVWGGTGPDGWDCSGWVGYLQQILMGLAPSEAAGRRLYTTYSLLGGSTAGLMPGAGPAGTVFVVGVADEHMAATLNGQPVEAGGAHGTSRIGAPAVGAFDPQFHSLFHLPNERIDGGTEGVSTFGAQAARVEPWTEEDQLDLEDARVKVLQAQEDRDKAYADEKKSDADRQAADIKVQRAELKVRELENKRDGIGVASQISTEPAPPLTGDMGEDAITLRQSEISLLDAQLARDRVYNDPESTSLDKEKADLQVYEAKNSLEETKRRIAEKEDEEKSGSKDGKSGEFSLKDRLKKYGADVFGILVDAVIEQASPFGESRWLNIPIPEFTPPEKGETTSKGKAKDDKKEGTFDREDLTKDLFPFQVIPGSFPGQDKQLGFNPSGGIPKWVEEQLKKSPLKVFDDGGWLEPGGMAINLSTRPEPIFNSPAQLLKFAGDQLSNLQPAVQSGGNDYSVHIHQPQFANESKMMREARRRQELSVMRHGGRPVF
jgi:TP901 family phage tail tape measure protein